MPDQPYTTSPDARTVSNDVLAGNAERAQQVTPQQRSEESKRKADAAALERSLRRAELQGGKVAKEARELRSMQDQAHGQGIEVHPPVTFRGREYGKAANDTPQTLRLYIAVEGIVHLVAVQGTVKD